MPKLRVADIAINQPDENGQPVETIYYKNERFYAIYRTRERVLIEFADTKENEEAQRKAIAPLAPLRGQLNTFLDDWRASDETKLQEKAKRYDRRIADALLIGLETDVPAAATLLEGIKYDLLEERKSTARVSYLIAAAATTIVLVLLFCFMTTAWYGAAVHAFSDQAQIMLMASGAGSVGAIFSIAQQIRQRSILTDQQMADNIADAILRVCIGAIAGAVLAALMETGLVKLSINNQSFDLTGTGPGCSALRCNLGKTLLIGFIAGFLERLVPDLLFKAAAAESAPPQPPAPGAEPKPKVDGGAARAGPPLAGAGGDETDKGPTEAGANPNAGAASIDAAMATITSSGAAPVAEDACLAHAPATRDEQTADADLPPASGGIEPPAGPGART